MLNQSCVSGFDIFIFYDFFSVHRFFQFYFITFVVHRLQWAHKTTAPDLPEVIPHLLDLSQGHHVQRVHRQPALPPAALLSTSIPGTLALILCFHGNNNNSNITITAATRSNQVISFQIL